MPATAKSPDGQISKMDSEFFRYPAVAEKDRAWGLYITGGGFVHVSPGSPYPVYAHPALYQFEWPETRTTFPRHSNARQECHRPNGATEGRL